MRVLGLIVLLLGLSSAAAAQDIPLADVAAAVDQDGRSEVFAVAKDGYIYGRWQQANKSQWSDWAENASGTFVDTQALRSSGRLYMFGLDGGSIVIRAQAAPGASWLPASFRSGDQLKTFAAAEDAAAHIAVLAVDSHGALWEMHSLKPSPEPQATDWSGWNQVAAGGLVRITLCRDASGRLTVAGYDSSGRLYLAQQSYAVSQTPWRSWASAPGQDPYQGKAELQGLKLVVGEDRTLWLLGIDSHGWLMGRALPYAGPPPKGPAAIEGATAIGPRQPATSPPRGVATTLMPTLQPPPALGVWTDWSVLAKPGAFLNALSVATNSSGLAEVAAIADQTSAVHLAQGADGSWSGSWSVLSNSDALGNPILSMPSQVALTTDANGGSRIVVLDSSSGKAFTAGRGKGEDWAKQTWTSLGKIPGVAEPDLIFALNECLEVLDGAQGLTPSQLAAKADALRASIAQAIPLRIGDAVAGTPLTGLIGNVNAQSRCIGQHEVLAMWLDHEAWPPAFQEAITFPPAAAFIYRIPAATLTNIMGGQIKQALTKVDAIKVDSYAIKLAAPNRIEINLDAEYKTFKFTAQAVATFSVNDKKPTCTSTLTATRPEGLYALISVFVPPVFLQQLTQLGDSVTEDNLARAGDSVKMVCGLTDAVLSSLFIPRDDPTTEPLQILRLPYDQITVDPVLGLVASGGVPILEAPNPQVTFVYFPVSPPAYAGSTDIHVAFLANTSDMDTKVTYSWAPANPNSLRLANSLNISAPLDNMAFYSFAITPNLTPQLYQLGSMTVTATDGQGQTATSTQPVSLATRTGP